MMEDHASLASAQWPERRRQSTERRRFSPATVIYGCLYSRRRYPQRLTDRSGYYSDWYDSRSIYISIGILLLSCADATLTLKLLQLGAVEVNPFMAALIDTDTWLFIIVKTALTGMCLIFLVIHAHFRLFRLLRVSHLLQAILCLYLLLIGYELVLLST